MERTRSHKHCTQRASSSSFIARSATSSVVQDTRIHKAPSGPKPLDMHMALSQSMCKASKPEVGHAMHRHCRHTMLLGGARSFKIKLFLVCGSLEWEALSCRLETQYSNDPKHFRRQWSRITNYCAFPKSAATSDSGTRTCVKEAMLHFPHKRITPLCVRAMDTVPRATASDCRVFPIRPNSAFTR